MTGNYSKIPPELCNNNVSRGYVRNEIHEIYAVGCYLRVDERLFTVFATLVVLAMAAAPPRGNPRRHNTRVFKSRRSNEQLDITTTRVTFRRTRIKTPDTYY